MKDEIELKHAEKGSEITFECSELVRTNDRVYKKINLEN